MKSGNGNGNGHGDGNGNGNHDGTSIHDMPELDVTESQVEGNGNGKSEGKPDGKPLYVKTGNRRLSGQILSPPSSISEAAAWTSLNLKNSEEVRKVHAVMNVINHCQEFEIECGLEEIKLYLTFIPAAGGWGRALAAMIETGIIVPSGLGVTKNVEEEVKKAAKKKEEEESHRERD